MQEEKRKRRERKLCLFLRRATHYFLKMILLLSLFSGQGTERQARRSSCYFFPPPSRPQEQAQVSSSRLSPAGLCQEVGSRKPGICMPLNHLPVTLHNGPSSALLSSPLEKQRCGQSDASISPAAVLLVPHHQGNICQFPREVWGIFNQGLIHPVN